MSSIAVKILFYISFTFMLASCDGARFTVSDQSEADLFTPQPIDDFTLLDHHGKSHQLSYYDDAQAIVFMVHGNGCPIVRNSLSDFQSLQDIFEEKNIRFFMLNSNLQDTRDLIAKEANEWGITVPILVDDTQLIGESLNLSRTAEVLIIDPKKLEIIYRGPLSDRLGYEVQKGTASNAYVSDALESLLVGKNIKAADQKTVGCLINFPYRGNDSTPPISYSKDVAPILIKRCVSCHRDDGIGPWSMSNYDLVRGFSPMIREVIRVDRMPPWGADPSIGKWVNDLNLTVEEKQTLVHWVEEGATRDNKEDPLELYQSPSITWPFGVPDLILDLPAIKIPATGVINYQFPTIENPLKEDVWVKAVAFKPGDPKALHHMYAGVLSNTEKSIWLHRQSTDNYLVVWTPGSKGGKMPAGTAVKLPHNARIAFEIHYTPYGRDTIDNSQIGLYFDKIKPNKILRYSEVKNEFLSIPPGAREHMVRAYHEFEFDAHLYMLLPHSHYRGRSSKVVLEYPNGDEELLLSVPKYNFNWQFGYSFTQPKSVPAGSKLVYSTVYDNSVHNMFNPDAYRRVPWGLQTYDEMLFAPFTYTLDDETPDNILHDADRLLFTRNKGYYDINWDGKLSFEEIPKEARRLYYPLFHRGDKNGDEMLSFRELMSVIN